MLAGNEWRQHWAEAKVRRKSPQPFRSHRAATPAFAVELFRYRGAANGLFGLCDDCTVSRCALGR